MSFKRFSFTLAVSILFATSMHAKVWTLDECIVYAMENNISLQKAGLSRMESNETYLSSKSALFPSLSFNTTQNVAYNPWRANGTSMVEGGHVESSSSTTSYNGSYSVGANWIVWDGNRNHNAVRKNALLEMESEQDSISIARKLEEQIVTLYIQILYSEEAVGVNKASLDAARRNEERAIKMVEVGAMSRAECSQLTATRAQDEYNVVQAESNVRNYKRQLKALLQIIDDEPFDVVDIKVTDAMALQAIPSLQSVYETAKCNRPEMRKAQLAVQSAEIQQRVAKSQRYPTVSMNASASTQNSTMANKMWGEQLRSNFNLGAGVSVSVPIFDQRQSRTAINKANIQRQTALLDVQNQETTLYSNIENYWIQANNNQNQYKAAKVSTTAANDSYQLLSEQFAVGLKNIVELQDGKVRLLTAQQNELQSKYMTILDIRMLELYKK